MAFRTYILRCSDETYHVGHTADLDERMAEHGLGVASGHTAKRRPLELLWATDLPDRDSAFHLERQLEGWSRAKKEAFMCGDFASLPVLARSRGTLRPAQGERDVAPSSRPAQAEPVEACSKLARP